MLVSKTKLFNKWGSLLVVAHKDDLEYGSYLFLHPEETDKVKKKYDNHKYQIVSIYANDVDSDAEHIVDMNTPFEDIKVENVSKYGYFVIKRPKI